MKLFSKTKILCGLISLIVFIILFFVFISFYINSDSFKKNVQDKASKELKMEVTIGTLDISLFGSVKATDVQVTDAKGAQAITLGLVDGHISILSLILGDVYPKDASLEGLSVNLLKDGDKWNIPALNVPPVLLDAQGKPVLDSDGNSVRMTGENYAKKLAVEKANNADKLVKVSDPQYLKLTNLNFKLVRQKAIEVTYKYEVEAEKVSLDLLGDIFNITSTGQLVYADTTVLDVDKWMAHGFEGTMNGNAEVKIDMTKEKAEPKFITTTMHLNKINIEELTKHIPKHVTIQYRPSGHTKNLLKLGQMAADYKNKKDGKHIDTKQAVKGLFNGTVVATYSNGISTAQADLQADELKVAHPVLASIMGLLDKPSEFMVFETAKIKLDLNDRLVKVNQFQLSNPRYASIVSTGGEIVLNFEDTSQSTVMLPVRFSMPSKHLRIKELRREGSDMSDFDFNIYGTFDKLEHTLLDAIWKPMENKLDAKIVKWMNRQKSKGIVIPETVRVKLLSIAKNIFMTTPSLDVQQLFAKSLGEIPNLLQDNAGAIIKQSIKNRLQKELDKKLGKGKANGNAGKILNILDGAINSDGKKGKPSLDAKGLLDIYSDVTKPEKADPASGNKKEPKKVETEHQRKKREKRKKRENQIKGVLELFK